MKRLALSMSCKQMIFFTQLYQNLFLQMDTIALRNLKNQLKLSVQGIEKKSQTILGGGYLRKRLWEFHLKYYQRSTYIESMIIETGNIYYQHNDESGTFRTIDGNGLLSDISYYGVSNLHSMIISYPEPQFLILEATEIITGKPFKNFMVAEHFITKNIYFIASDTFFSEGGLLYAADVGKGAAEVVAEKVDVGFNPKLTALAVDQFTGDIMLAGRSSSCDFIFIERLQKLPYLHQMMEYAGFSSSEEVS